jgi:adenine phosphoribosyltransferase
MFYEVDIAGMKRKLKLFPVADDVQIAAFILYGDVEITEHAARELLAKAPEYDIMLTS